MRGFKPSEIIDNPELLFGRNKSGQLLDKLLANILRGTNCQLVGERRSGKTSVLKCFISLLNSKHKSIIPVFIDFKKQYLIKGNTNVHRYVIACFIVELTKRKLFDGFILLNGNIKIQPNLNIDNSFDYLMQINDFKIQGVLEDFILTFSELLEMSFVLVIDEYEYLFQTTLDNPQGFMVYRTLSEQPSSDNYKPFTFVIAGAKTREKIASMIGSPELNTIGASDLVTSPLNFTDFSEMFNYYVSFFDEDQKIAFSNIQKYFDLSGGIPFFAKVIGQSVLTQNCTIDFSILKSNFEDLNKNLDPEEIVLIRNISNKLSVQRNTIIGNRLVERGILKIEKKDYALNGILLNEYFKEKFNLRQDIISSRENFQNNLIDKIMILISKINQESIDKGKNEIFVCSNDDTQNFLNLKSICININDLKIFASSIYQIIFERTKSSSTRGTRAINLNLLPSGFKTDNHFVNIVDSLRQNYGGHSTSLPSFTPSRTQIIRGSLLLELLGAKNEPVNDDFYKIQSFITREFEIYLHSLYVFVTTHRTW